MAPGSGRYGRPSPSGRASRPWRRNPGNPPGCAVRGRRCRRCPHPPQRPRRPSRPRRKPRLAGICRFRAADSPCRGPSGQPCADRRPGAARPQQSRRTWWWRSPGRDEQPPAACTDDPPLSSQRLPDRLCCASYLSPRGHGGQPGRAALPQLFRSRPALSAVSRQPSAVSQEWLSPSTAPSQQ